MITLHAGEKIQLVVRKHWFSFFLTALFFALLALLPLLLADYAWALVADSPLLVGLDSSGLFLFLYAVWFLGLWVMLALEWTDYYLDVWYITDERLVDIEQKWLFHRDEAILRFDKIEDIAVETRGLIATLLGFGTIRIQTAGTEREFIMRFAAHPDHIKAVISALHDRLLERPQAVRVIAE